MPKRKRSQRIKPFQLVRLKGGVYPDLGSPFRETDRFVYLGETEQMPGHGTFVRFPDVRIFVNYHVDAFERIPDEEC